MNTIEWRAHWVAEDFDEVDHFSLTYPSREALFGAYGKVIESAIIEVQTSQTPEHGMSNTGFESGWIAEEKCAVR